MSEHTIAFQVPKRIVIEVREGSDAVTRVTGPGGAEWREHMYDLYTEDEVFEHWAYNASENGVTDACRLEGWADLEPGEVTMTVTELLGPRRLEA